MLGGARSVLLGCRSLCGFASANGPDSRVCAIHTFKVVFVVVAWEEVGLEVVVDGEGTTVEDDGITVEEEVVLGIAVEEEVVATAEDEDEVGGAAVEEEVGASVDEVVVTGTVVDEDEEVEEVEETELEVLKTGGEAPQALTTLVSRVTADPA